MLNTLHFNNCLIFFTQPVTDWLELILLGFSSLKVPRRVSTISLEQCRGTRRHSGRLFKYKSNKSRKFNNRLFRLLNGESAKARLAFESGSCLRGRCPHLTPLALEYLPKMYSQLATAAVYDWASSLHFYSGYSPLF